MPRTVDYGTAEEMDARLTEHQRRLEVKAIERRERYEARLPGPRDGAVHYRRFKEGVCQRCGFKPENPCQLDVHHPNGDRRADKGQVGVERITLCANCHRLEHRRKRVESEA